MLYIFRYFFTSRDGFWDSWILAFLGVDWTHRMLVGARLADDLLPPLLYTVILDQNGLRPGWPGLKPAPAWESPCPPSVFKYHPSILFDQSHCKNIHLHNLYRCFSWNPRKICVTPCLFNAHLNTSLYDRPWKKSIYFKNWHFGRIKIGIGRICAGSLLLCIGVTLSSAKVDFTLTISKPYSKTYLSCCHWKEISSV